VRTEDWLRLQGCGRKVRFATEADALAMEIRLAANHRKYQGRYHCAYCDGWHLTSQQLGTRPVRRKP
jgi:hypothetical protein